MKELVKTLVNEFEDKEYAHAYMEEFSNMAIAAQIKVLREQRGWTQAQLADAAKMKQERISALENVDYDAWTVKILRRLAKAFDLTIKISFEKFSDSISDISKLNAESLKRASRVQDLKEFSCNGSGYERTFWVKPVTVPNLHSLSPNTPPANDTKYCEIFNLAT